MKLEIQSYQSEINDISYFGEIKEIKIISTQNNNGWTNNRESMKMKFPAVCHRVILQGNVEIVNKDEITIETLEQ